MKTARQLIDAKATGIISVTPDTTVYEALSLMAERRVGAVLVLEGTRLVGIFTERDYARKVALLDRTSRGTLVREVMTDSVVCVGGDATTESCMALMDEKKFRHLPVVDGDRVLGVLSIRDLVQETVSHQQFIIEQLQTYIRS